MKKKQKKELTFTAVNSPSEKALEFHAKFMFRMFMEGRIKTNLQAIKVEC